MNSRRPSLWLLAAGLSPFAFAPVAQAPLGAQPIALRGDLVAGVTGLRDPMSGAASLRRSRAVGIDSRLLDSLAAGDAVRIELFADRVFLARFARREDFGGGRYNWFGDLGTPNSRFILSVVSGGDAIVGSFYPNDGSPHDLVLQTAPGMSVVREFRRGHSACGCRHGANALPVARPGLHGIGGRGPSGGAGTGGATGGGGGAGGGCTESGDEIRVLMAYTQAAAAQAGGAAQIDAQAQLLLAELNLAVRNSGIASLVYSRAGLHATTDGFVTDQATTLGNWQATLERLTAPSDGFMDDVHATRSATGADLVALLVQDAPAYQGGTAGYAGVLNSSAGAAESSAAFSVSNYRYREVFPHEVGHNMGCAHDCFTGCGNGIQPYSNGWKWAGSQPGTSVMGYADAGRPYYPIFSTPNVQIGGVPVGDATYADCARTLSETKQVIANYRGGCVFPFGSGCGGRIGARGTTSPGDVYEVTGSSPAGNGVLFLGFSDTSWLGLPLPVDLSFLGLAGCSAATSGDVQLYSGAVPTASNAFVLIPVSLPNSPSLTGMRLYHQWFFFQPGQPISAITTSRGLNVEVDV